MVRILNSQDWCIKCMHSVPYTKASYVLYSSAFMYDGYMWRRINGCICKYLSAELCGYTTCYEMNVDFGTTAGGCADCGERYRANPP